MKERTGSMKLTILTNALLLFSFIGFILLLQSNIYADELLLQDKEAIKQSIKEGQGPLGPIYSYILGYAALRESDPFLCNTLFSGGEICRDVVVQLSYLRSLAQNKCEHADLLPPGKRQEYMVGFDAMVSFCKNMGNCEAQTVDGMKDRCYGFQMGDIYLMKKGIDAFIEAFNPNERKPSGAKLTEELSVYQGFKQGGHQNICEQYAAPLAGKQAYLCEVLFGHLSVDSILDSVAEDLAYFLLSKKNKDLCGNINNIKVKSACYTLSGPETYFEIPSFSLGGQNDGADASLMTYSENY